MISLNGIMPMSDSYINNNIVYNQEIVDWALL